MIAPLIQSVWLFDLDRRIIRGRSTGPYRGALYPLVSIITADGRRKVISLANVKGKQLQCRADIFDNGAD